MCQSFYNGLLCIASFATSWNVKVSVVHKTTERMWKKALDVEVMDSWHSDDKSYLTEIRS